MGTVHIIDLWLSSMQMQTLSVNGPEERLLAELNHENFWLNNIKVIEM